MLTALIWGAAFVAQSAGVEQNGPFTFNTIRMILGGIVLIPCIALFDKMRHVRLGLSLIHICSTGMPTDAASMSVEEIAEKVGPSVVEVTTETVSYSNFFGQYVTSGAGSGVIISEDGYIITNNHVIEGASSIKVRLSDKTEYDATLVGTDSKTDIAVLKIEATGLTPAVIGDSDTLKVGEFALAVGNPLGTLGGTVTDLSLIHISSMRSVPRV